MPTPPSIPRARKPPPDEVPGADPYVPGGRPTLSQLRTAVQGCHGCTLYREATQAVFGEGSVASRVMLVGEVPGDREDLAGRPFVGPSGVLLDEALAHARIPRDEAYVTNVVKHFKFTRRGKRRLHDKPTRYEIAACKPWLVRELELIEPAIVVLLGATAAQALLGPDLRVTKVRGQVLTDTALAHWTFATVHPSSVLRAPDEQTRRRSREAFLRDFEEIGDYFRRR